MSFNVVGCVALVTGANRGIGRAIVQSLVEHGADKVYAAVRSLDSAQELVAEFGAKISPVRIDLEDPESIIAAAKEASDVNLVVSNAGVLRTSGPLDDSVIDDLTFEINVNVLGLLRMAKAFAPVLKTNGGGAFVQLNSIASVRAFPPFATYCASKAAAYSLTQSLRSVLAEHGTDVLSVHPGPIDTSMAADAGLEETDPPSVVSEGIIAALTNGDVHLFPDSMAKEVWEAYQGFAKEVVEKV